MKKYKTISKAEYYFKLKDLIVFASYETNDTIVKLSTAIAQNNLKTVIFNLRDSLKQELKLILDKDELTEMIYIDDKTNIDIKYIVDKCNELSADYDNLYIMIDYENELKHKGNDVTYKLKQLSKKLNTNVIVTTQINADLDIKELKNKGLVKSADVVVLSNDEQKLTILAKNKYGKIGIIPDE